MLPGPGALARAQMGIGLFLPLDEMARSSHGNSYCVLAAVSIAGLALAGFCIS